MAELSGSVSGSSCYSDINSPPNRILCRGLCRIRTRTRARQGSSMGKLHPPHCAHGERGTGVAPTGMFKCIGGESVSREHVHFFTANAYSLAFFFKHFPRL